MKDMSTTKTHDATLPRPLRLWPGVVLAIALMLARYVVPLFAGEATIFEFPVALLAIFAGMGCAVAIVVWWMFFSRARWSDRLGALLVMIAALVGDQVCRASVDRRRRDGKHGLRSGVPDHDPRLGRGSGRRPPPLCRTDAHRSDRKHPRRVRVVDTCANRGRQGCRHGRSRMAVDADCGGTSPRRSPG